MVGEGFKKNYTPMYNPENKGKKFGHPGAGV
jgi:hypothetical protein